jgi:hypothetical protein
MLLLHGSITDLTDAANPFLAVCRRHAGVRAARYY